jgi:hypothetical protein
MTDDFRWSEGKSDVAIVDAAISLARQISKAFSARHGRPPSYEAERLAILLEAFQYAADVAPIDLPETP